MDTSNYVSGTSTRLNAAIIDTSNYVSGTSTRLDAAIIDTCNYVSGTSTRLDAAIIDTSNYVSGTSTRLDAAIIDTCNYVSGTSTRLDAAIIDTSNYVSATSNNVIKYIIENVRDTSNQITNNIVETSNIFSGRVNIISEWVSHLTCDEVPQGTSNKFIVNNEYSSNLTILGTLTASNLNIIGTTTTIKTATYETENLEIISQASDGPCLKVIQNGTQDVAQFFDGSTNVLTIRDGGNVGIGSTLPSEKLEVSGNMNVAGNIRVAGNIIPSVDITYDLGSANQRWKDLYMSGNTIYINNTRVSADPVTKGLIVKDDNNNLVDVTVASIKIKNAGTNSYSELKTTNNKISLVRYDTSGAEVDTTDIAATGVNTSNYVYTSVNSLNTTINTLGTTLDTVDSNISNYVLSKVSPLEMLTKINENILNPVIWYQFNDDPFVAGSIITDSNTSSGTTKYNLTFTSNDGGSFDMSFYNDKNALEAWYQFDNNVIDSSSFNRAITASGSIQYSTDAARGTYSFNFNGSTSISITNTISVLTSYPLSICFWIKPIWASTGNYLNDLQTIFSTINGNCGLRFDIRNVSGVVDLFLGVYNNGAWLSGMTVLSNMQENQFNKWMHIGITLSSSSGGKGYVNGVLTGSATLANINLSSYPNGNFNLSQQYYMKNGTKLDDFRIYSKILTASNVYVLYSSTVQKTTGYTANSYYYTNAYLYNGLTTYANDNIYLAYTGSALNIQGLLNQFHNAEACSIHLVFKTANITSISQIFYIGNTSVGDLIRIYVNNANFTFKIGSAIATTVVTGDTWYVCDLVFTYASSGNMILNIYMNGSLVTTNNATLYNNLLNNVNISGLVFYIGRYTDASDATPVILQDFRIYSLALTTNHISYMQYGSSSIPVGQWTATSNIRSLYYIGNVGIGTTLPDGNYKLDVLGNFKLTGTFNNITSNEISYLSGITSSVQTQINSTSNQISSRITLLDSNISNYISTKSSTSGDTSSQWTTNTGYISYNNIQVYPSEIRVNNPAGVLIPSWVWYQFKTGLLSLDRSGNDRLLTNNGGTYALDGGKNSILLETGDDASFTNANWSTFTDLSISGWFKASALADGDKLLEFKYNSSTTQYKIQLSNSGSTLTDFQVKLNIPYQSTFRTDFQDIRIFDEDNTTPLNYWIESVSSGVSADIWIKVPSFTNGKFLNVSYGNSISTGNADNVFNLYDNFTDSTIDTTKWRLSTSWNALGTAPVIENNYLKCVRTTIDANVSGLDTINNMPNDCIIELKTCVKGTNPIPAVFFRANNTTNNGIKVRYDTRGGANSGLGVVLNNPYSGWSILSGGSSTAFPKISGASPVASDWKNIKAQVLNNNAQLWYEGISYNNYGFGTSVNYNSTGKIGLHTHFDGTLYVDEIKVYKASANTTSATFQVNTINTDYGISIKKVLTNLSFQIDSTPIYTTPSFANNTWTHILWSITNSSANGFVRLSTTAIGTENIYTKVLPTSGSYVNKLGSITNVSSVNISDFRILTIPLTDTTKSELYSPTILYSTLVDDAYLTSTSNLISSRTTILDSNASNYTLSTSNQLTNRLNSLNTDNVNQGTSNRFITNHEYSNNLRIYGTLTTSNLNVIGTTTTITTATYQTENLEIISQANDGSAFKVIQNGTQDIAQFFDASVNVMTIRDGGNVGIGSTLPSEKLDIVGNIKLSGSINNTSSNEIEYVKGVTSPLQSQISTNSNIISMRITTLDTNASNYVSSTSNQITNRITTLDTNASNYVSSTSNQITHRITILDSNASNYVSSTSNQITNRITTLDSNISNYVSTKPSNAPSSQWVTTGNNIYYTTGNVGIGITNPATKLHVVGDIAATGNVTAYYSDERLKTITSNITNSMEIIDNLNGFYYIPNELAKQNGIYHNKQEIGLSAQQVNKVLPELVSLAPFDLMMTDDGKLISKSGENYLTISYDRLAPIFVESLKHLNNQVISLKEENCDLKEKYNQLVQEIVMIKGALLSL